MPLDSNANVVIKMKGLGILHHNGVKWEAILLREIFDHQLEIKVTKIGQDGKPIEPDNIVKVPDEVKQIEVKTDNIGVAPTHIFHRNSFEYHPGKDGPMDAGWILDISKELHKKPVKLSRKTDNGLTLLTVDNATLYTANQHDIAKPYLMVDIDLNSLPHNPPQFVNPRVMADHVGMDIVWSNDTTSTEIILSNGSKISLPRVDKIARYEVLIDNNCKNDCRLTTGDFSLYYRHLIDMGNEEFLEISPRLKEVMKAAIEHKFSFTVEKIEDFNKPDIVEYNNTIAEIALNYDGKTNDCGFIMCSELKDTDTLGGLIKP
jgi:hypothetical protein